MENMTIAQALRKIKSVKEEIKDAKDKMQSYISFKKDEAPPVEFSFDVQRKLYNSLKDDLVTLESKVAEANATNKVVYKDKEMSLTLAIRTLQEFKDELACLKDLLLRVKPEKEETFDCHYDEDKDKQIRVKVTVENVNALSKVQIENEMREIKNNFESLNFILESANHRTKI